MALPRPDIGASADGSRIAENVGWRARSDGGIDDRARRIHRRVEIDEVDKDLSNRRRAVGEILRQRNVARQHDAGGVAQEQRVAERVRKKYDKAFEKLAK